MKNYFIYLIFLFTVMSCKNEENTELTSVIDNQETTISSIQNIKKLKIEIDYLTNKDDDFRLIFNKISYNSQILNISLTDKIFVKEATQKIIFELPIEGKPKSISLGLGNKEEKEIEFKNIKLYYDQNEFNISQNDLLKYFNFNKFSSFDTISKKIITKKINNSHSPVITIKPVVKNIIYK